MSFVTNNVLHPHTVEQQPFILATLGGRLGGTLSSACARSAAHARPLTRPGEEGRQRGVWGAAAAVSGGGRAACDALCNDLCSPALHRGTCLPCKYAASTSSAANITITTTRCMGQPETSSHLYEKRHVARTPARRAWVCRRKCTCCFHTRQPASQPCVYSAAAWSCARARPARRSPRPRIFTIFFARTSFQLIAKTLSSSYRPTAIPRCQPYPPAARHR
jgi:hypothetical protein